ncbi:MAG: NUDIX hydrolase [Chloroflexi bacterium]|nr:NUDIX hydrolase [Chloroflexota bacterium]MYD46916.1 NUDIX hydrolase [Chloroflexota bacterium]
MSNLVFPSDDASEVAGAAVEYGHDPGQTGLASDSFPSGPKTDVKVVSAGGLVFRRSGDLVETLLCARLRHGHQREDPPLTWRLPKGTPEHGETVEETARREVQEETGVHVNVLAPITSIRYFFVGHDDGVHYDKTVYFFLMEPRGGNTADHDAEFDVVEWHSYEQALELLEYDNERNVLEAARSLIEAHGQDGRP